MAEENSQEFQNNLQLNSDQLKTFAEALVAATRETNAKAEADRKAKQAEEEATNQLKAFGKQLGASVIDYSKNLLTGGEGVGKFSGSVTGASDALGNLVQQRFGPLGFVIGGLIKIIGQLAGASLKQNDVLVKAYRDLAEVGTVSGSIEKVIGDLHRVGLTTEELDKFNNLIKKTAPELSSFGGSVSAGKDKLLGVIQGMIGPNNQIEQAMARIGYGAEEMRDATADYIAKQTKLGLSQGKTQDELRQGAVKYMTTLRELQELTGLSRDEAQKLLDQQLNDYRFRNHLRQLEVEGRGDEAKRLQAAMAAYEQAFGKQSATDLMEQIVNKGALVGEASVRAQLSTQGAAYQAMMKAQKGQISMYGAIAETVAGMDRNMDQLGASYNIAGQGINQLSGSEEALRARLELRGKTEQQIQETLQKNMKTTGDRLDQNTRMEQEARALRITADKALYEVGNVMVSIFEKINRVVFQFGKMLARVIDTFGKYVGLGETNLSAQFREVSDVDTDLKVAQQEKQNLIDEQIRLERELEDAKAGNLDYNKQIRDLQKEIADMQRDRGKYQGEERVNFNKQIAEKQRQMNEMVAMQREVGSKGRQGEIEAREKRLLEVREQLAARQGDIVKLEKERVQLGGGIAGSRDAAAGTNFDKEIKSSQDKINSLKDQLAKEEEIKKTQQNKNVADTQSRNAQIKGLEDELVRLQKERQNIGSNTQLRVKNTAQVDKTLAQLNELRKASVEADAKNRQELEGREKNILKIKEGLTTEEKNLQRLTKEKLISQTPVGNLEQLKAHYDEQISVGQKRIADLNNDLYLAQKYGDKTKENEIIAKLANEKNALRAVYDKQIEVEQKRIVDINNQLLVAKKEGNKDRERELIADLNKSSDSLRVLYNRQILSSQQNITELKNQLVVAQKQGNKDKERELISKITDESNSLKQVYDRQLLVGQTKIADLDRQLGVEQELQLAERSKLAKEKEYNNSQIKNMTDELQRMRTIERKKYQGDDLARYDKVISDKENRLVEFTKKARETEQNNQEAIDRRERFLLTTRENLVKEDLNIQKLEKQKAELEEETKTATQPSPPPPVAGAPTPATTPPAAPRIDSTARGMSAITGKEVSQQKLEARMKAGAELAQSAVGRADEILGKIRFKNKEENIGGGKIDPAALSLAEKIHQQLPNTIFTAMNDKFHQKEFPGSKHTRGKAIDFATNPPPKDAKEAAVIKEQIKDMGASKVLDEYFADKNQYTTGGHFHVEVARHGGIFSGPESGYPVILHGNEAVVPMPNLDTFVSDVKKQSLDSINERKLPESPPQTITTKADTAGVEVLAEMLSTKFEDMIDQLESANYTLKDLLTYTKA